MLKLTGCKEDGEFTCDDGQCIVMGERCDRIADCRDGSDERGCKLFSLLEDYEMSVSPIARVSPLNRSIKTVPIHISLGPMKMMGIAESENTTDLQFEIILEWKDQQITYYNLKKASFLNTLTLTETEMKSIWLPILVYANTDQQETTRLGWTTE